MALSMTQILIKGLSILFLDEDRFCDSYQSMQIGDLQGMFCLSIDLPACLSVCLSRTPSTAG